MKIFSHFASHWYLSLLFACVLLYNLVLQGNDNHICQIFGIFLVVRSAMQEVCGRTERRQNTRLRSRFFSRSHNFPYSSSYAKVRVHVTTRSSKTASKLLGGRRKLLFPAAAACFGKSPVGTIGFFCSKHDGNGR